MVQSVATLISLLIAAGMLAVIVGVLADDWGVVVSAFRLRPTLSASLHPMPGCSKASDRRARVIRVRAQSAPRRAAA